MRCEMKSKSKTKSKVKTAVVRGRAKARGAGSGARGAGKTQAKTKRVTGSSGPAPGPRPPSPTRLPSTSSGPEPAEGSSSQADSVGGYAVEWRGLGAVKPYPGNPRKNDKAVAAMAESIRQFGFRQPIVVDAGGVIVCGHTRLKAAKQLGLERVPVHVAADLTEAQVRAYRLADNKPSDLAEWDYDLLKVEVDALEADGFELAPLGFEDAAGGGGEGSRPSLDGVEYRVVVDCEGEAHQAELLERFAAEGLNCRALMS